MFSILHRPLFGLWPDLEFARFLPHRGTKRVVLIDLAEMPENLQRDIGFRDGRGRRGEKLQEAGAFEAIRLIGSQRPL